MFSRSFPHRFHSQERERERESLSDDVSKGGDDEVEGGGGGGGGGSSGDAAAAAGGKRPRGRPPGSKNRPKVPAGEAAAEPAPAPAMRPHVLEIRAGHDVADALASFVRRRGVGICVLSATGAVSDVTIRGGGCGPPAAEGGGAAVRLLGRLEILSMSGALLPPAPAPAAGLAVSLSGPQGQVLGGTVAGPMVAAETVVVVAAAFSNPAVHRVPAEDDAAEAAAAAASAATPEEDLHHHQRRGSATPRAAAPAPATSVYGAHFPSEVAWAAPAARPPPHY